MEIIDVTLAMPVYNVEKYVQESLMSALNQTYENIEFLIIDDKGSDNSMDIIYEIKKSHARGKNIRIIDHIVNQGTGATKNTAIKEAAGKYIFFMDSDDYIEPNTIELLMSVAEKNNVDVVYSSHLFEKPNGKIISKWIMPEYEIKGNFAIFNWMAKTGKYYLTPTWNKLYNIDFLRKSNVFCYPKHRNEDNWFSFQVAMYANSIISIPDVTYHYVSREMSTVNQKLNDFYYNQYIELFNARLELMKNYSTEYPMICYEYLIAPLFEYQLSRVVNSDMPDEKKIAFIDVALEMDRVGVKAEYLNKKYISTYHILHTRNIHKIKVHFKNLNKGERFRNILRKLGIKY